MSTTIATTTIGTTILTTVPATTVTTTVPPTTTTTTVPPTTTTPPVTTTPNNPDGKSEECIPCYPEIPTTSSPPPIPIPTTLKGSPIIINRNEPDIITILVNHLTTTPIIESEPIITTVQISTTTQPIINSNIERICHFDCQQLKF